MLFEQLFELFSVGVVFSSRLFELIRVVFISVLVILVGPNYCGGSHQRDKAKLHRKARSLSEGGTMRLETLIEFKSLNSSFSNSNLSIRAFRAQICQFELIELIFLLKLHKQFPVEQFYASRAIRADSTSVFSTLPPSLPSPHSLPSTLFLSLPPLLSPPPF